MDNQVSLSAYAGNSNVSIEFVATYGGDYQGDIAIDNISVNECVVMPIYGCIDPLAPNYDSNADTDNGSCVFYCYGEVVDINTVSWDGYGMVGYGASFDITDVNGVVIPTVNPAPAAYFVLHEDSICLDVPGCYDIKLTANIPQGCDAFPFVTKTVIDFIDNKRNIKFFCFCY